MTQVSKCQSKDKMHDHINSKEGPLLSHEDTIENQEPVRQSVTTQMVVFSLFIALIGWIFNFDLGGSPKKKK